MKPVSIHDYLWDSSSYPVKPFCVVFGDDPFLKSYAIRILRDRVLDGEDAEFSLTRFEGDTLVLDRLLKEVSTMAMFGSGRRFVLVEGADAFLSKYRPELEDYAEKPSDKSVLTLQLQSFPSNTKLFKALVVSGLVIEAKALPEKEVPKWIVQWSKRIHKTTCRTEAAEMLLYRVGPEHGLLDQELAKLALMVPPKGSITVELVEKAVGSWRAQSTFEMLDLALSGKTAAAIRQLDNLMLAGENPVGILAQIAYTLRKFGAATELILDAEKSGKKITVSAALEKVGIRSYFIRKSEEQMIKLGRYRGGQLHDWLLAIDLDMKGGSRSDPRFLLETLIVKISEPRLRLPKKE